MPDEAAAGAHRHSVVAAHWRLERGTEADRARYNPLQRASYSTVVFGLRESLKYPSRITVTDTAEGIGDGLGSGSPAAGYSWYAGI
jgi:hypothetical protein